MSETKKYDSAEFLGFRPLPKRATVITPEMIKQIEEELLLEECTKYISTAGHADQSNLNSPI